MKSSWIEDNRALKDSGFELLTLAALRPDSIKAVWLDPSTGQQIQLGLDVAEKRFPSLATTLPETAWDEREIHDLLGWTPQGHPDLRPLIRTPRWPESFLPLDSSFPKPRWLDVEPDLPAIKVEGDGITYMKVGPTHAGIIESGHFVFSIIGENVLHLDAHLFQNHRGIESMVEGKRIDETARILSRVCAADTVSNQANFAQAVEKVAGFDPTPVLVNQRIVLLEAERVLSHLNDLAQIPAGAGFQVAHQRALAIKEQWQRSLEMLFGHRFLFDAILPGSARHAPPEQVISCVSELHNLWSAWRRSTCSHRGFINRMQGVGITPPDRVIRMGAQGVAARASGKPFDARQSHPWYEELFSKAALKSSGDVNARFQVRLDEVEDSIRIIKNAAEKLGGMPPHEPRFKVPDDLDGQVTTFNESPHGLNVHAAVFKTGRIGRYHIRSASFRNWPLLAQTVAGNGVADFPLINKSFELCYSCTDR